MIEKRIVVELESGLQARPAALFVQEANRYTSDIFLEKDGKKVNAKSIMGVMSLAIASGVEVNLQVDGDDEAEAFESLINFVNQKQQ